jgi:hypothetical protein
MEAIVSNNHIEIPAREAQVVFGRKNSDNIFFIGNCNSAPLGLEARFVIHFALAHLEMKVGVKIDAVPNI